MENQPYDIIFEIFKQLSCKDIMNLKLVNKNNYHNISIILEHFFNGLPKYIKLDRNFKCHHHDIFIALQDIYPESNLYNILKFLQSRQFKKLKEKTDKYIKTHGLGKAVRSVYFENNNLLPISLFDTEGIKDMQNLFFNTEFDEPLNLWNVSSVKNMCHMLYMTCYNKPLNLWDVSSVLFMKYMFYDSCFIQPLDSWKVDQVKTMNHMFVNCSDYNKSIEKWNLSLKKYRKMFSLW